MIPDLHNSIYFWGAVGLVYVYFQFQQLPEVLIIINPTQEQIYADPTLADITEVKVMCWNEITQYPQECKK